MIVRTQHKNLFFNFFNIHQNSQHILHLIKTEHVIKFLFLNMHQETKCTICCETCHDYTILSCSHQLCHSCYEKLVKSAMKAKNHVKCPFCRQVQYPCCKSYLLSSPSSLSAGNPTRTNSVSSESNSSHVASNAQEHVHLTVRETCDTYEHEKQPMFAKVVGLVVMCACVAIAIYAIVNVTEKN